MIFLMVYIQISDSFDFYMIYQYRTLSTWEIDFDLTTHLWSHRSYTASTSYQSSSPIFRDPILLMSKEAAITLRRSFNPGLGLDLCTLVTVEQCYYSCRLSRILDTMTD